VVYRRGAQLRLAECHEIRQRVGAATHSLIGASYCVRRDVHRKDMLPRHLWHCFCLYAMPRARTKLCWLRKSADADYSRASAALAVMYATGEGVPQDPQQVLKQAKKAAKQHSLKAKPFLAYSTWTVWASPKTWQKV
jgi:TPR repeat protein